MTSSRYVLSDVRLLLVHQLHRLDTRRGCHFHRMVGEGLADLVGEDFPEPLQVAAETHRILLDFLVTCFGDVLVENRVLQP